MGCELKLIELGGDLFKSPHNFSLGHCISSDFHLGKGIAKDFLAKFHSTYQDLKMVKFGVGEVAVFNDDKRFVYNLVTKRFYYQKPTYTTLRCSLNQMRDHMLANNVTQLALPRLACGLDKLDWKTVKSMLVECFKDDPFEIRVYTLTDENYTKVLTVIPFLYPTPTPSPHGCFDSGFIMYLKDYTCPNSDDRI